MSGTILFLVGPTASGKTAVAVELAALTPAEIVSADSMLVYKGMDIGTAKPAPAERKEIPHHLIDIAEPSETFSAFDFRKQALSIINDIHSRGKLPIVAGGSGLYIKALTDGLSAQPGADENLRNALESRADKEGLITLYEDLSSRDPEAAAKIKPGDRRRIIRALEIIQCSGKTPSEWYREREPLENLGYRAVMTGLSRNRAELYEDINRRVDQMFERGLLEEVKTLSRLTLSKTARQAVGYKEVLAWLEKSPEGKAPAEKTLENLKSDIKKHTRHLAKRQLTWFRRDPRIHWVECPSGTPAKETAALIHSFLRNS